MSFRSRLGRSFAVIVVIPAVAGGVVAAVVAPGARLPVALLTVGFVLVGLVYGAVVSRRLSRRLATFVEATRRLSRGDFRPLARFPHDDEFAELAGEFNDMSAELQSKMEEAERKREELADTIRRVGDALATGVDRDGVVALAVRQAVDACDAEVGRALPLAHGAFPSATWARCPATSSRPSKRPSAMSSW